MKLLAIKITNIWRSILALFGRCPGFYGEYILWKFLTSKFQNDDVVILKHTGVFFKDRFYPFDLPILKFVFNDSMTLTVGNISSSKVSLRNFIKRDNPNIDKEYFQAYALYLFTTYGSIICNFFVISKIMRLWEIDSIFRGTLSAAWLIPNTYFVIQLFLYHLTKLKAIQFSHAFTEATNQEVEEFFIRKENPGVVSVIPFYMEDSKLIKNSLYCHCLQRYPQRSVVLLLGNDYYTTNENVNANTTDTLDLVKTIGEEFDKNNQNMSKLAAEIDPYIAKDDHKEVFNRLISMYTYILSWLENKYEELQSGTEKYPTDSFLFDFTFKDQIDYYSRIVEELQKVDHDSFDHHEIERTITLNVNKCLSFFRVKLSSFLRYKYLNLEHERTKAGNLTGYLSLLDKDWKEQPTQDGKYFISMGDDLPKDSSSYVGIFDTDTIAKPDYLIRKVAYLERSENEQVGLVQSPYNVPTPEPTIAACASGIHSMWFLPISIGMTSFKSAFWLGFNGLFRKKAITSFNGSFIAETLIEDLENSLKVIKKGYSITTSPEYQCQTFSPPDMQGMRVQRQRWASGGFRIAYIYIKDSLKGQFGKASIFEWFLRLNYIMGLNILPLVLTITILLECPYYHAFFGVETLPFFFYILTYLTCLKNSSFTWKHYFDGLAVGLFMNFHYLKGTWTSFKVLLKKKSTQIFKATPRVKSKSYMSLTTFELFAIFFIIPLLLYRIKMSYDRGHYWDVYPVYTIFSIFYGIARLVGVPGFLNNISDIVKSNRFKTK